MSDWEESEEEKPSKQPVVANKKANKWEGEDEEEEAPASDWEESSEEEDEEDEKPAPVAPPKKKGTLKAKLAEKEAAKAAAKSAGEVDYDSDDVLDPRAKAKEDKEREVNADLQNAAELFGAAAHGGTSSSDLDKIISFQPRTKEDFQQLSSLIIEFVIKRHQNKPLYPSFVEHHVRELAIPLKDVEVRKAASGLTTLANEKQKEQREKVGGKKKPKGAVKPGLGSSKSSNKVDTSLYDEALDDFGTNPDDFM